jgi:hypothetical protein
MNFAQILANVARGRHALQQDAQANVPVIPNNGNPAGAFNMPHRPPMPTQMQPTPVVAPIQSTQTQALPMPTPPATSVPAQNKYFYPWMNPSPAMQQVYQMLGQRRGQMMGENTMDQPQMDPLRREMILPQRR